MLASHPSSVTFKGTTLTKTRLLGTVVDKKRQGQTEGSTERTPERHRWFIAGWNGYNSSKLRWRETIGGDLQRLHKTEPTLHLSGDLHNKASYAHKKAYKWEWRKHFRHSKVRIKCKDTYLCIGDTLAWSYDIEAQIQRYHDHLSRSETSVHQSQIHYLRK